MRKLTLLVTLLLPSISAHAEGRTFLLIEGGSPVLTIALDPTLQPGLGSPAFLGIEISKTLDRLPLALGLYSRVMFGGKFGTLPVGQTGLSAYYFPFSKPESRLAIDTEVTVQSSALVPYLKIQGGLSFLSLHDPQDTGVSFGVSSLTYGIAAGIRFPVTTDLNSGFEAGYTSTLNASDPNSAPILLYGLIFSGHFTIPIN